MIRQPPLATRIVNDADLTREAAGPTSRRSLVPMLIVGLVLTLIGMIAAALLS